MILGILLLLSILTRSECPVCEAWSCPVDISPMRINRALKAELREQGARYVGSLREARSNGRVSIGPCLRLVHRLNITYRV